MNALAFINDPNDRIDLRGYNLERLNILAKQGGLLWQRVGEVRLVSWVVIANLLDLLDTYAGLNEDFSTIIMWEDCVPIPTLAPRVS